METINKLYTTVKEFYRFTGITPTHVFLSPELEKEVIKLSFENNWYYEFKIHDHILLDDCPTGYLLAVKDPRIPTMSSHIWATSKCKVTKTIDDRLAEYTSTLYVMKIGV